MAFLKEPLCASFNTIKTKKKEDTLHCILLGKVLLALCSKREEEVRELDGRAGRALVSVSASRSKDRVYGRLADKLANLNLGAHNEKQIHAMW